MPGETKDLQSESDFPRRAILDGDEIIPGIDPSTGLPIGIPVHLLQTQSIGLTAATWLALTAIEGSTFGQRAEVPYSDAGTHTDPIVGGTVDNSGVYAWSTAPNGWKRISDLQDAPPGMPQPYDAWTIGAVYQQNSVLGNGGSGYWAKSLHVATSTDEPGVGVDWEDFWIRFAEKGEEGEKGDKGDKGDDGDKGDTGNDGKTWYYGTTVPSNGLGVNGDMYLRTSTGAVYVREAGAWVLKGTFQGPAGPPASSTYDPPVSFRSKPGSNEIIGVMQTRLDMNLKANFADSVASIAVNPTASFAVRVFDCSKMSDAGTQIGTVTFSTGGVPSFATTGGTAKVVAAGRVVKFLAPASADATAEGILITLAGDVTGATLSLGSMSNQNSNAVNISGGAIDDVDMDGVELTNAKITSLTAAITVAQGGTGVTSLAALKTLLGLPATAGVFPKMRKFSYTGGSQTYTKTTGTKRVRVWGVAGGAGGRYASASGGDSGAGSGGGGSGCWGYVEIDVSAISGFSLFVGAGGAANTAGQATTVGSSSEYLNLPGGAIGGVGSGGGARAGRGGLGGVPITAGLFATAGAPGGNGTGVEVYGNRWGSGGHGGSTPFGSGGLGGFQSVGANATGPGGGGGGGGSHSGAGYREGGTGFNGEVRIEELAD